jgi:hypothetical protein
MLFVSSTFQGVLFALWLIKALQLYYGYCIYIKCFCGPKFVYSLTFLFD